MKPRPDNTKYFTEVSACVSDTPMVIPVQRALYKNGFSFSKESFGTQLPIWDHLWKTGATRCRLHAYFFLEQFITKKEYHKATWETTRVWQNDVNDWGFCDALAKVNTKVLETLPGEVYSQLRKWNTDGDLWKRRQSAVSLLYFSRTKKVFLPFEQIEALVVPLLGDKEYYVQKGVGWALREMHTVYPEQSIQLLQQHLKAISPIAFTIAIEKMGKEKEILKMRRKIK